MKMLWPIAVNAGAINESGWRLYGGNGVRCIEEEPQWQ